MTTIFERKNTPNEQITFEDLTNEYSRVLPKREEMNVMNYNMGYPYGMGYDGYYANSHDNYYERVDCYGRSYEYHPAKFDYHKDWDDDWKDDHNWKDGRDWDGVNWEAEEFMRYSQMSYNSASFDPYFSGGYGDGYNGDGYNGDGYNGYNPNVWYGNDNYMNSGYYGANGPYGSYPGYV